MITSVHNYSSKANFTEKSHLKLKLRKRVAEALGILRVQLGALCQTRISTVMVHLHYIKHLDGLFQFQAQ